MQGLCNNPPHFRRPAWLTSMFSQEHPLVELGQFAGVSKALVISFLGHCRCWVAVGCWSLMVFGEKGLLAVKTGWSWNHRSCLKLHFSKPAEKTTAMRCWQEKNKHLKNPKRHVDFELLSLVISTTCISVHCHYGFHEPIKPMVTYWVGCIAMFGPPSCK